MCDIFFSKKIKARDLVYLKKRRELKQHVYVAVSDEHLSRIGKVQERADGNWALVIQVDRTVTTLSHVHLEHSSESKRVHRQTFG